MIVTLFCFALTFLAKIPVAVTAPLLDSPPSTLILPSDVIAVASVSTIDPSIV